MAEQTDPSTTTRTACSGISQADSSPLSAKTLEAARAGSSDAIGKLLENCRRYLLLVANSSLGSGLQGKVGASDLVQDTFLEAQRIFDRFTGRNEEELLRWLTRILENKLGNTLKRYVGSEKRDVSRELPLHAAGSDNPSRAIPEPGMFDPPSGDLRLFEEFSRVRSAIARLSPEYQRVIELRIGRELPFAEIGRLMNRSTDAARKLFARAVDESRLYLDGADEQSPPRA